MSVGGLTMADFYEAWAARDAARSTQTGATANSRSATPADRKYAEAALNAECAIVRAVPIGDGRNHQLNISSMKLGQLVAANAIDEDTVVQALGEAAASRCGYRAPCS